jgi:hypothetical protein
MLPQHEKQISRSPEGRGRMLERKLKGEREVIDTEALERERERERESERCTLQAHHSESAWI